MFVIHFTDLNMISRYTLKFYTLKLSRISFNFESIQDLLPLGFGIPDEPPYYVRQCTLAFTFSDRSNLMKLSRGNLLHFIYGTLSLHSPAHLQVHHSLHHLGRITKRSHSKDSY